MATERPLIVVHGDDALIRNELLVPLRAAGFAVHPDRGDALHAAALVIQIVSQLPELDVADTRRWRADRAASPVPILWLVDDTTLAHAAAGLEAGADACLVRPVDGEILVAQVQALIRTHHNLSRFAAKGADAHGLTERLQKAYLQFELESGFSRKCVEAFLPHVPTSWCHWHYRASTRGTIGLFDVQEDHAESRRWALVDVSGLGRARGACLGLALVAGYFRSAPCTLPAVALSEANLRVRNLDVPEAAVISAAFGMWNHTTGIVRVASAGLPAPVFLQRDGQTRIWHGSGLFLGAAATGYTDVTGTLASGDRLVQMAGGASVDKRPDLRELLTQLTSMSKVAFTETLAKQLLRDTDDADGFTLVTISG